ncbi:sperm-associated antigen 8 [Hyperolius riggenbachi]|uniref:sperm-associated antigen 8 n=1 Tax=Hyperolius riggenbachi TaxID=752182 RepID=UPI0035A3801C
MEEQRPPLTARSPCLLSNWLEERATAGLDSSPVDPIGEGHAHRHGHRGILTTDLLAQIADLTTKQDSYQMPATDHTHHTGRREQLIRRFLQHKYSQEVLEELSSPPEEVALPESSMKSDYHIEGFIPKTTPPTKSHDYRREQAVTFWTENKHNITGMSDVRSRDTPFKKSSAFSTPISEYLDQPVPHSLENYPNM